MMKQKTFYNLDDPKIALRERNAFAKKMSEKGYNIIKSSLGNQLLSFGGIGTGEPHIERWTKVYMVSYYKDL